MAQSSWLDDEQNPLPDPWATPPAADDQATAQASAPPPAAPSGGDWTIPDATATAGSNGSYATDLGTPGGSQAVDPTQVQAGADHGGVTGTGGTGASGDVAKYQSSLDAIHKATDPQSKAAAQDSLARQLQQDLEADGHKVTWKGNTLMVDGRAYELAGEGVQASTAGGPGGYTGMPGFETSRANNPADNDPKTVFQRWAASLGGHITGDDVRAFVASDPRWEINPASSPNDPQIRVKQTALDAWKPGASVWQETIRDAGPGGANAAQFMNAAGTGPGYANDAPAGGGASGGSSWLTPTGGGPNEQTTAPTYNPSWINEAVDIPGFQELYRMASDPSNTDQQMDDYITQLLAHPDTLSERDVETLKAKNAEEAATASQQQDEELQHFGFGAGLDSSPWLAGQRAENQWNRRSATINSNRNVDIAAADRRSSDRTAAAGLGQGWASYKTGKKQAALNFAVDSAIATAGESRNRHALNESLSQAATSLGLQKDELIHQYVQTNLGYDIDLKKLAQSDDQFKQNLLQRVSELRQADDQFKAQYGLDVQKFDHTKDQDMWDRSRSDSGGA